MSIPRHVVQAAVDGLWSNLHELCGIRRPDGGKHRDAVEEWLSWSGHELELDRWADDGGRTP